MKWKTIIWRSGIVLALLLVLTGVLDQYLKWSWFPEAIVAWGTITLAYTTYLLGKTTREENAKLLNENRELAEQNRQMHAQDMERNSKSRRLDEVQHWVVSAINIRTTYEGGGSASFWTATEKIEALLATSEYIRLEANLLDSDLSKFPNIGNKHKDNLEGIISKVSVFLGTHKGLTPISGAEYSEQLRTKCIDAFGILSDLRAELTL